MNKSFATKLLAATKYPPALLLALSVGLTMSANAADSDVMRPVISEANIPVQEISPVAVDGFAGEAFLRKPAGEGPFPAVLLIHGGAPRWSTDMLREYSVGIHASRFLEAGYVVVSMTRRDLDLQLPLNQVQEPVMDAVAMIDYLRNQTYVDADSIVVRGTSVGGYLTLEIAAARDVAAIMVEEPFSFPFVGIALGTEDATVDSRKIKRLENPILLVRGDQTPNINDFNRDTFIPAVEAAGLSLEILTYPGEMHSFAFYDNEERTVDPADSLDAFMKTDAFFRKHIAVQPSALDPGLVTHAAAR